MTEKTQFTKDELELILSALRAVNVPDDALNQRVANLRRKVSLLFEPVPKAE